MRRMISGLTAILAMLPLSLQAETAIRQFDVTTPRPFGYVIGDVFEQEFRLTLNEPYRLERDSLPEPGRVSLGLALRAVDLHTAHSSGATDYRLNFRFQIVSAPKTLTELFTPEYTLRFTDQAQSLTISVPSRGFAVSPLTSMDEPVAVAVDIRPDRPPPKIATGPILWRLAWVGIGIVGVGVFLAYVYLAIPFLNKTKGPFSRAYRNLKRLKRREWSPSLLEQAMRAFHGALNETAGRVVFERDLPEFFERFPQFMSVRASVESIFKKSQSIFFGQDGWSSAVERDLGDLIRLCGRCRDLERNLG